jgi:hypothetical protein
MATSPSGRVKGNPTVSKGSSGQQGVRRSGVGYNTGSLTRTFKVQTTSASLLKNLDRAWSLGLITNKGVYTGLRSELVQAKA